MYWNNTMKLTLKDAETAATALEIMKTRLTDGFDCDKDYKVSPSKEMRDYMEIDNNTIVLPEDLGTYLPDDSMIVIPELIQYLAEHLSEETFTFNTCNSSDYDESWVDGNYENGELKVKSTYLPNGFFSIDCTECGEQIALMEDNIEGNIWIVSANNELIASEEELKKGKIYICPDCGEEIDLSEWVMISKNSIKII